MRAITVKYCGPTDTKSSRLTAQCEGGRVTISYDSAKSPLENAEHAMSELVRSMAWQSKFPHWVGGSLGDAWVFVARNDALTVTVTA